MLIPFAQACLNAPEPSQGNENGVDDSNQVDSPEEPPNHMQQQQGRSMPQNPHMPPGAYMPAVGGPMDPNALAYQNYVQRGGQYAIPPQGGMPQHAQHQS